jgi:hypothetical protein
MDTLLANPQVILLFALAVLVIMVALAFVAGQQRRSSELKERFGPEYDHAVATLGDRRQAEAELVSRTKRVKAFDIHPLTTEQRERFATRWRETQVHFVDDPVGAIREADRLVNEAMTGRGYPMEDFDARAADISVDYAPVVTNYRAAHDIATRNERGAASTEELRQAMVHFRTLFNELLESNDTGRASQREKEL